MSIMKLLKQVFLLTILLGLASPSMAQTTYTDRFSGSVIASIGKQPVIVATTANIGLFYSQAIDGVVVSDHTTDGTGQKADRVLVKNQSDQTQNGIYVVSNTGAWTRAQDFSGNSGVVNGQLVLVNNGTQFGLWTVTTPDPIAVGPLNNVMSGTPSNITFSTINIPGAGTVVSGSANHLAYYPTSTNSVSSNSFLTIGTTGILSATGFSGPLTGAVTGNVTGTLTGNSTGMHSGSLASSVTATTQSPGDNSTKIATTAYLANAATRTPTIITATGSGTYTTPAGAYMLHVRGVGGGGGGSAPSGSAGGTGGTTSFGTAGAQGQALGGVGGGIPATGSMSGGLGGVATNGAITVQGNPGGGVAATASQVNLGGSVGGSGPFGGAGIGGQAGGAPVGGSGAPNSGSGGGGGLSTGSTIGGVGGGAGGYFETWITAPAGTYAYAVGAGGTAGVASNSGGAGGSGELIIEAF